MSELWQELRASQYWQHKSLADMSQQEWEALCDGCGKCCLHKLIDDQTDELYYTDVACRLLDTGSVQCSDYDNRHATVPDCLVFTPDNLPDLYWLPLSCAYRTLHEGRQLQKWHPLISGRYDSVHQFKRSIKNRCVSEDSVAIDQLEERIIVWV